MAVNLLKLWVPVVSRNFRHGHHRPSRTGKRSINNCTILAGAPRESGGWSVPALLQRYSLPG